MKKEKLTSRRSPKARPINVKNGPRFDAFDLKVIAITAMAIDHVGALIYPEALWLRVIGRLAMPIIAFLLVEGYHHTRHLGRYLLRLLLFALLAQPFYRLVFPHGLNVLFDLLLGLCVIWAVERIHSRWLVAALLFVVSIAGFYIALDWWHLGILMVFVFHATRGHFGWTVAALGGLLLANAGFFAVVSARTGDPSYQLINFINLGCMLALPLLSRHNGQRGRDWRYLFYTFYPAHLLVIYAIMH
ncbi:TraX family protein [Prosthecobacter sp.]|uniref:TraX family protein n=1 Tax=Prosthecobacter sp. TaxID=1965333 RepID=UPI0037CC6630